MTFLFSFTGLWSIYIAGLLSGRVLSLLTDHCWFSVLLTHVDNQPSLYISLLWFFFTIWLWFNLQFSFCISLLDSLILKILGFNFFFFVSRTSPSLISFQNYAQNQLLNKVLAHTRPARDLCRIPLRISNWSHHLLAATVSSQPFKPTASFTSIIFTGYSR